MRIAPIALLLFSLISFKLIHVQASPPPVSLRMPSTGMPLLTPREELHLSLVQIMRRCKRCVWGVMIKRVPAGEFLFAFNDSRPFNPASNTKLITLAAALTQLGSNFRYFTNVYAKQVGDTLPSGIYLEGSGDPSLDTYALARLASDLFKRGIRKIEGPLYLDTSTMEAAVDPPGFQRFSSTHVYRAG